MSSEAKWLCKSKWSREGMKSQTQSCSSGIREILRHSFVENQKCVHCDYTAGYCTAACQLHMHACAGSLPPVVAMSRTSRADYAVTTCHARLVLHDTSTGAMPSCRVPVLVPALSGRQQLSHDDAGQRITELSQLLVHATTAMATPGDRQVTQTAHLVSKSGHFAVALAPLGLYSDRQLQVDLALCSGTHVSAMQP